MNRRDFSTASPAAAVAALPVGRADALDLRMGAGFYDAIEPFGNASLLHFTDCHAQLLPVYSASERQPRFRVRRGQAPHLVGEALLKHFGIAPGTRRRTHSPISTSRKPRARTARPAASRTSATLVKKLKATRPGALALLDGGDTWQGSATSLWTKGQDMVDACKLLGVDVMTGHWSSPTARTGSRRSSRRISPARSTSSRRT